LVGEPLPVGSHRVRVLIHDRRGLAEVTRDAGHRGRRTHGDHEHAGKKGEHDQDEDWR
jgi:hypothetical protein